MTHHSWWALAVAAMVARRGHQLGAAEGDFTLTPVATPTGVGWSLTNSSHLAPPGYCYLVAGDARDVPS